MVCIVDTHALVWFLEGNQRLSEQARAAMTAADAQLIIPAIVLAEIAYLYSKSRLRIDMESVLSHVAGAKNSTIYPLDEVVVEHLPAGLNIHDSIIVATALVFRDVLGDTATVITKDTEITKSGLVETLW